jgi:hypothetical protein
MTPGAQLGALIVVAEVVAPNISPGTLTQLVPEVKVTALPQTSLRSVTQIVKVDATLVLEKILIT